MEMTKEILLGTVEALRKRGFKAQFCATADEAKAYVLNEATDAKTVGFGGSVTVKELGLIEDIEAGGKEILRHGDPGLTPDEKVQVMNRQLTCDLFLLSANALTIDGRIVNIDGNGNRVAASIYGPEKVIFIVGRNKVVTGGVDDAIARIKRCACPPNCRRLGRKTPCAELNVCTDCDSPDRICKVTVIMERKPTKVDARVLVVDEDLGY